MNKNPYDIISLTYDQRYQTEPMKEIGEAIKENAKFSNATSIIELGCGTGYWLNYFLEDFLSLCGIDYSLGMLKKAKAKNNDCIFIHSKAEGIPFKENSFDYAFCVNAFHHFSDKPQVLNEAFRIIKPGGNFSIVCVDPRTPDDFWYLYDYFPERLSNDLNRFPSLTETFQMLKGAHFCDISITPIYLIKKELQNEEVFEDSFLQKGGSSQLSSLTTSEYEAGIEKIRKTIMNNKSKGIVSKFSARITYYMITCKKH